MINPCFYYYFTKASEDKVLTAKQKETGKGFELTMEDPNEDPSQLWMVKSADLQNVYYIYHCNSCLCLEATRDRIVHLYHCRDKDSQKFKFSTISIHHSEFQISDYSKEARLLLKGNKISCEITDSETTIWRLMRVKEKSMFVGTALIENDISGYVLDVENRAQKEGARIFQGAWSGMFCQRWKFEKFKDFYLIRNVKSDKVITVKGTTSKVGSQIVQSQEIDSNHRHQLWSFQQKGYHLYSIRLASEKDLFLGVSDVAREQAVIVLGRDPLKCVWRIIGYPDL